MNSIYLIVLFAQAILLQNTYGQCLKTCSNILASGPGFGHCCGGPVMSAAPCVTGVPTTIVQPSVANTLADTLSLLTVSSLLAETLPLNSCACSAPCTACAPAVSYGGCGYGCGYGCGCGCDGRYGFMF